MKTEPVLTYGLIVAAISAGIAMLMSLEVISLSDGQFAAVMAFVSAVAVLGAAVARRYVTPLAKPRDSDGAELTREDNSPALQARPTGWKHDAH